MGGGEGGSYQTGCPLGGAVAARWRRAAADCRCRGLCEPWGRMQSPLWAAAAANGGCFGGGRSICKCGDGFWPFSRGGLPPEETGHKLVYASARRKPARDLSCSRSWAARAHSNLATRTHPKEQRTCLIEAPHSVSTAKRTNSSSQSRCKTPELSEHPELSLPQLLRQPLAASAEYTRAL